MLNGVLRIGLVLVSVAIATQMISLVNTLGAFVSPLLSSFAIAAAAVLVCMTALAVATTRD